MITQLTKSVALSNIVTGQTDTSVHQIVHYIVN